MAELKHRNKEQKKIKIPLSYGMCESAELSPSVDLMKMRYSPRKEAFYILLWKGIHLHTSIYADHLSEHR